MPIIKVILLSGHEPGVKTRLANMLTDAYRMVIAAPHAAITIVLEELDHDNYMRGGARRRRSDVMPDPIDVVAAYGSAFMKGDFATVRACVTDDLVYRLPEGVVLHAPEDAAAWLSQGWKTLKVTGSPAETAFGERGPIVYVRATLSGERANGETFVDRRVVLRYGFAGGKIASVEIWTDLPPAAQPPGADP